MPDELPEGASFGDILTPEPDATAIPVPEVKDEPAATEGGETPEPETLGLLKEEEEAPEGDGTPDLKPSDEFAAYLEKHPNLKAHWEAETARFQKGIDKYINETNVKLKEAESFRTEHQEVIDFAESFKDPATVDETFDGLCKVLAKGYNRPFGGFNPDGSRASGVEAEQPDGRSKYGFEYPEDDKIVDTTVNVLLPQITALLDQRLGPISKKIESETQTEQTMAKVNESLPILKSQYEISSDPWVTQDMVKDAIAAFPTLMPQQAFAAMYPKQIAAYAVKHAGGQQVRNLPQNNAGGKARSDLKTGASFEDILVAEATI